MDHRITIRPVVQDDFAQWQPLWAGYNAFYGRAGETALPEKVTEAARGTGVGRSLINAVYDCAAKAGSQRVYWHTHETNHTAMRLYDKVADKPGFVVYRKML